MISRALQPQAVNDSGVAPPPSADTEPRLAFTLDEAARLLGMSRRALWSRVRSGVCPHRRLGHLIRLTREDLDAYLDSCAVKPRRRS